MLPIVRILTAKKPFNLQQPFTTAKHDSHIKSTGADYFLDIDYDKLHITEQQKNHIMQDFSKVCKILFTYLEQSNTNVK